MVTWMNGSMMLPEMPFPLGFVEKLQRLVTGDWGRQCCDLLGYFCSSCSYNTIKVSLTVTII